MSTKSTWRVTIIETIAHATDIEAVTWRQAERIAERRWNSIGPDAFNATTLGRCAASSTIEVPS